VSSLNKQAQVPAHEWDSHLNQAKMRSQHDSKWFKSQVLSCRPTFEAASEQIAMKSQHQLSSRLTILFRDLTQMNDPLPS
jgi:hypothetical protein